MGNPEHNDPLSWRSQLPARRFPRSREGIPFTGDPLATPTRMACPSRGLRHRSRQPLPPPVLTGTPAAPVLQFTMDRDLAARAPTILEISTDLTAAAPEAGPPSPPQPSSAGPP